MTQKIELTPLISEDEIRIHTHKIVESIAKEYRGQEMVVIGLLKGSFMFMADLVRQLHLYDMRLIIDFLIVSSYGAGTRSSGNVNILRDVSVEIQDRQVLIVDDILDSGRTLESVTNYLKKMNPALLKTCVLLDKPERRVKPFEADYAGFTIPDKFVVGYGLDYDGKYRELPAIFSVEESV